jgi:putative phosphoribosyl transferase
MTRFENSVQIIVGQETLEGSVVVPEGAAGIVMFANASGKIRHGASTRSLAAALNRAGLATLVFDLLTPAEAEEDTTALRYDVELLAGRLAAATEWARSQPETRALRIGYLGCGAGAAAAVVAGADRPDLVAAVVSLAGRTDLAGGALNHLEAPTLFIVGTDDRYLLSLHERAWRWPRGTSHLEMVPGATDLLADPVTAEDVARMAAEWFMLHLAAVSSPASA